MKQSMLKQIGRWARRNDHRSKEMDVEVIWVFAVLVAVVLVSNWYRDKSKGGGW